MDIEHYKAKKEEYNQVFGNPSGLINSDLVFEINGEKENACFFNWFEVFDRQSEVEDCFDAQNIEDNHIPEYLIEHVENYKLIPVVVLGFRDVLDLQSMSEIGTMFVDMSRKEGNDAPIVYCDLEAIDEEEGEPKDMGFTFQALLQKLEPEE